jgi:hypothetical protein
MSATVHALPAVTLCPSCDSAMANRRELYRCGYCSARYEYGGTRDIIGRDGKVASTARIWYRLRDTEATNG